MRIEYYIFYENRKGFTLGVVIINLYYIVIINIILYVGWEGFVKIQFLEGVVGILLLLEKVCVLVIFFDICLIFY